MERGLRAIIKETGSHDINQIIEKYSEDTQNQEIVDLLAKNFTVGETYFFRDRNIFECIGKEIIPDITSGYKKKSLKIWSAGCSSGEEIYSLSMYLRDSIPDIDYWDITLIGSDINKNLLNKAHTGKYTNWSFRNSQPLYDSKYFRRREDGTFEISGNIKSSVKFVFLNLKSNSYPSFENNLHSFDLILCRNVLMYFDEDSKSEVIEKFYSCLNENGWIIFSPFDINEKVNLLFERKNYNDTLIFKKEKVKPKQEKIRHIASDILFTAYENITFPLRRLNRGLPLRNQRKKESLPVKKQSRRTEPGTNIQIEKETDNKQKNKGIDEKQLTEILHKSEKHSLRGEYKKTIDDLSHLDLNKITNESLLTKYYVLFCKSLVNFGMGEVAKKICSDAVGRLRLSVELNMLTATIYRESGELENAIEFLKNALYLSPDLILADFYLAIIYKNIGNNNLSIKYFRKVINNLKNKDENHLIEYSEGMNAKELLEVSKRLSSELVY